MLYIYIYMYRYKWCLVGFVLAIHVIFPRTPEIATATRTALGAEQKHWGDFPGDLEAEWGLRQKMAGEFGCTTRKHAEYGDFGCNQKYINSSPVLIYCRYPGLFCWHVCTIICIYLCLFIYLFIYWFMYMKLFPHGSSQSRPFWIWFPLWMSIPYFLRRRHSYNNNMQSCY